jgi:histidyl-tRNA synthetase
VRGLDYYLRTVFEVVSPRLGTSTVLCGGGRYDRLIADLGGPQVPGVGFAIGEDRLVEVLPESFTGEVLSRPRVYVVPVGDGVAGELLFIAREWMRRGVPLELELGGRSLKAALRRADKDGFSVVAILGEEELASGQVSVRDLTRGVQQRLPIDSFPSFWQEFTSA